MKDRASTLIPLVLLIFLAGASFWLNRVIQADNPKGPQRHAPDYFVENFKISRFDSTGKLQHTIVAKKMTHYADDDTTVVDEPHMTYYRQSPMEIVARTALIGMDGKEIDLINKVRVVRHTADDSPPTVMETNTLKLFPDEERGYSNSPVVITQGQSIMNGSGLDFDNGTSKSVLRGRVTGILHRNPTKTP